jgi:aminoglycoside phosphotransferase (APT) family kinase protein
VGEDEMGSSAGTEDATEAWLDVPGPVRRGQEIDVAHLADYLSEAAPELLSGPLSIEQFPSGYSNLTYMVTAGDRSLILRRPPVGVEIATAHDMGREHRILSHLAPVYPKAPSPLLYCEDPAPIGTPFYLMERVEGVILRKEMPPGRRPPPDLVSRIAVGLVETQAELHAVDYEAAGLGSLGRPEGYVRRQIEGWTRRYRRAETEPIPEATNVANWLHDSMPQESDASLIHNDFKHDNVVLDPDDWARITAVLDWEMATLGDPLMDVGTSLAYWTQPDDPPELLATRLSPTLLPGTPGRADVLELYARVSGRAVDDSVFYYAYGLFKVAVIVQQLYVRYQSGLTTDSRFASLGDSVRALTSVAWQAVQKRRIDDLF